MIPIKHKHISSAMSKNILRQNTQLHVQKTHSNFFVRKKFIHVPTHYKIKIYVKQRNIILKTKMAFLNKFKQF
ncbi:hypothetical protein B7991_08875 [Fibrobacter sp. UWB3]|nr:hypothetical protein B7991_08875 [Fibrobacter sp. UWB3]